MAPNLNTLPTETLTLILHQFCLHCSKEHGYNSPDGYFRSTAYDQKPDQPSWYSRDYRRTLHSLCLVSKCLRSVAEPILYHEFIPGYGDSWRSTQFSWNGRLAPFLRTIAARPDLAARVKRIFVHSFLLRGVSEEEVQTLLREIFRASGSPGANERLAEYVVAFDERQRDHWFSKGGGTVAGLELLGVFLALVPNLERLSLQLKETGGLPTGTLATVKGLSRSNMPILSNLKSLDVYPRNAGGWLCGVNDYAGEILEAVQASKGSLSTLNLHKSAGVAGVNLHGLQTLRVIQARLTDWSLAQLLGLCKTPGLKSFYYEATLPLTDRYSCIQGDFRGGDHFQPLNAIQHLLTHHRQTLTTLHLDLRYRGQMYSQKDLRTSDSTWFDIECLSSTRMSLSSFPALKHVFLNAAAVCNVPHKPGLTSDDEDNQILTNLLPPNIESLCLAAWVRESVKPRMAKSLVFLAKTIKRGKRFRALRRVRCDVAMAEGRILEGYGVSKAFERAGVYFGYQGWETSPVVMRYDEGTPEPELVEE